MSEQWNGIMLAEVRVSLIRKLSNNLHTVFRLIDNNKSLDYEFDTSTQGAVIVTNNYMNWEFVAPLGFVVNSGGTVSDLFDNLAATSVSGRVPRWEEFATFLNSNKSTINTFLTEGGTATIKDANGNAYPGVMHQISSFTSFYDMVVWMKSWMGTAILSAPSSIVYAQSNRIRFSLTASGTTISCSFLI